MKNVVLLIIAILFGSGYCSAQFKNWEKDSLYDGYIVHATHYEGEWIPYYKLNTFIVFPPRTFSSKKEYEKYSRLAKNVKKVYPYSLIVKYKLEEIAQTLETLETEKQKKKYIDQAEKELKAEFEGQIRSMTFTQGRILIKLINRETGETTYQIVKDLKGSLTAFFWQSVAVIFSSSLKYEYDAKGDDALIEEIVLRLENQQLYNFDPQVQKYMKNK